MTDLPPNSHKARETETREPIKPVTSAETRQRKRGLGRQFRETFLGGNGRDAASVMVDDVVVPGIRDMLYDALRAGLDNLIYGDTRTGRRRHSSPLVGGPVMGGTNYSSMSTSAAKAPAQQTISRQSRARHEFDDLIIPTREDAVEVIDQMYEILSRYGRVSVADLFELTGVRSSHVDEKWGWQNLRGAKAVPLRKGGFLLDLPTPEELR